ncbi:MAG TPA: glycoside hydrolase family 15 protein [Acidimicrobiales bacterium]|nr:glycoside hydrolase family 15 protein [Acidimicrobiales bacterium]
MSTPLEDYALLGDTESAALVSASGSIDWLCFPRFDSPSCFAALLGTPNHGRWLLAPSDGRRCRSRAYREGGLVLETRYESDEGAVTVIDCMPPRDGNPDVVRVVRGEAGRVEMRMELVIRFDYGHIVPWVRRIEGRTVALGGPDGLVLTTPLHVHGENLRTVATFVVSAGDQVPFDLTWFPSHEPLPAITDPLASVERADRWWQNWAAQLTYQGRWSEAVQRSLCVLKALTFAPTGAVVAAPTTSLPEDLGGVRNWDYRYSWLRDATFTLDALLASGYTEEALAWRDWLLRSVAGDPADLQIMYGVAGERRLPELTLGWLPGYEGSTPVRVGNGAWDQFQLDVYGEVLDSLHQARRSGIESDDAAWSLQRALLANLEEVWDQPDEGIWEVRSGRQHFTHSKVMAWVALDRAVAGIERYGLDGPLDRWRALRDRIHGEVCTEGYDAERNTFVQHYGGTGLDASLLMLPLVNFLPPDDPRIVGTVEAVERELTVDGFVHRYDPGHTDDGLAGGEASFLMCSFWLADCLHLIGRHRDARALFERLFDIRNDVGLLAEEYDAGAGRMIGNFPQAFSHVALIDTAGILSAVRHPAQERRG